MTTDYTPLHGGDPFPADWREVDAYGTRVAQTGALIAESVALLRRCANAENWQTETADAFREQAEELADTIDKSRERYELVGARLRQVSDTFDLAEAAGRSQAVLARQEEAAAGSSEAEPGTADDGSPVPLTDEERQANNQRQGAIDEIARLQGLFDQEVERARAAAEAAANDIKGYLDDDVKDSWWDRNAGWIRVVTTVLGYIAAVAAIVMIFVATGGTAFIVAMIVAAAAGLISLAFNVGMASSGNGSWWNVAFDALGVLTLGVGGLALRGLARGMPALRAAVAPLRGSAAYQASMGRLFGLPRAVNTFRARLPFNVLGQRTAGTNALVRMRETAETASTLAISRTLTPRPGVVQRFVYGGRESAADIGQARQFVRELADMPQLADDIVQAGIQATQATRAMQATTVVNVADSIVGGEPIADANVSIIGDGLARSGGADALADLVRSLR